MTAGHKTTKISKRTRRSTKIVHLLKKHGDDDVHLSDTPTQVVFVANSGVICGVPPERIQSLFAPFDSECEYVIYPSKKSYSFVIFSDVTKASASVAELQDKPFQLAFVSNAPSICHNERNAEISGLSVVEDFLSEQDEQQLVAFLEAYVGNSTQLRNRTVFHFGYTFDYTNTENNARDPTTQIPEEIAKLIEKLTARGFLSDNERPDQVTVNVYEEPGQGIPSHVDTHSAFEEAIVSVSLQSDIVMEFKDCANPTVSTDVLLPRRSLLVMRGEARYRYRHGIKCRKYDVNPITNRLFYRQKRISVTFRKVRRQPCECKFPEYCDWDRYGEMAIPHSELDGRRLERKYVEDVYANIADHFDETRHSQWKAVSGFLDGLDSGSLVFDAGCGNGKYLTTRKHLVKLGCDLCEGLVSIAKQKGAEVLRGDALALPIRSKSVDAAISIAVIHHMSTEERRRRAIEEIVRVLRPGGTALVTVWAMDQAVDGESEYMKMRANKENGTPHIDETIEATQKLRVHDGKHFAQQDMFVPWQRQLDDGTTQQFLRYYHIFTSGELAALVQSVPGCRLVSVTYEQGNWIATFQRL